MSSYAELICRTHYSFLRGASHPFELISRAAELGLSALAITDLNGVYAIPKAYRAIKNHPQLKLIVGAELTLEKRAQRLHLLAMNRSGYGLLCRLLTASHAGRKKGEVALAWDQFTDLIERKESEGLIAIVKVGNEGTDDSELDYGYLKNIFEDRIYSGLYRVLDGRDSERTRKVVQLYKKLQIPIVATNDVHYHIPRRKILQDVLASIREGISIDQMGTRLFPNGERYLKSAFEMSQLFRDLPEAIENTLKISDQCHFCPSELRYFYPSEWIPPGETAQSYLERLTWAGAKRRYPQRIPENVAQQLRHELKLIEDLRFSDYFLTIWEIITFATERKILCQGRGSAANSVVCFCLGITAVDPVKMSLLFERFISVERGEPPDIDVDFEHERREEVIQHIYQKYGRDRAGMVSAIITYRTRSAIRDIQKALGNSTTQDQLSPLVEEVKGFPRHLSIHSGGFTLSACPIIETVPIEPARMEGRTIVQWDKEDLDTIGLLKVDILALGMLSALRKTFDSIGPEKGLSLATIPPDDPETYRMIRRAETVGVFQIESRAQMSMLPRLLPRNFYDLVIEVAIVRPGPIQGQMVHPYLKRRHGLEEAQCPHPLLEPILGRTAGVPLFQEQVMKIAMVMGGFTAGEADELRRAIGAWRSSGSIEKLGLKLKRGLLASGLSEEFGERIFKQIQGFAEYGFPESHAASFALIVYASAYVKCHYPAEFTCALLNSQPMGFYSCHTLVEEVKRQGVTVLPVHPDFSQWDCTLEEMAESSIGKERGIRIGWRTVQGLSRRDAEQLVAESRKEKFKGLVDFLSRTRLSLSILCRLAMGDVFLSYGLTQREALWKILAAWKFYRPASFCDQQMNLFSYHEGNELERGELSGSSFLLSLSLLEAIQADYEAFRLSVRGHPMRGLREEKWGRKRIPPLTTAGLKKLEDGKSARLGGLVIVRQRPPTAKGTVFATLEDEFGFADLILYQNIYEKFKSSFESSPFLIVSGRVQRSGEGVTLKVRFLSPLLEELSGLVA